MLGRCLKKKFKERSRCGIDAARCEDWLVIPWAEGSSVLFLFCDLVRT
jgi:hypothetical protein